MASFTELEVWKQARKIRNFISDLTKTFPTEEKYRLVDQVIRSSRSIGNNIAEGHGVITIRIIFASVLWHGVRYPKH